MFFYEIDAKMNYQETNISAFEELQYINNYLHAPNFTHYYIWPNVYKKSLYCTSKEIIKTMLCPGNKNQITQFLFFQEIHFLICRILLAKIHLVQDIQIVDLNQDIFAFPYTKLMKRKLPRQLLLVLGSIRINIFTLTFRVDRIILLFNKFS